MAIGARTKTIGDIGVSAAIKKCIENNIQVSIPFGDNYTYDLVIDYMNKLYRVQVKTTEFIKNGVMAFETNRTNPYKLTKTRYTKDDADLVFLYCIENEYLGVIKIDECGSHITLRIESTLNGQRKNIKYAHNYSFVNFFKEVDNPTEGTNNA